MKEGSFLERTVAGAIRQFTRLSLGYDPEFMSEMVVVLGVRGFFEWAGHLDQVIKDSTEMFGAAQAQWLIGAAAMWNGCRFCSVGHTLAGNVIYFGESKKLFPLDEVEMHELQTQRDEEILEEMERRLGTDYPEELRLLQRQYHLKYDSLSPSGEEDRMLLSIIAAWDLVNECSIIADQDDPHNAEPLDAVAKKKDLVAAYRTARESERTAKSAE